MKRCRIGHLLNTERWNVEVWRKLKYFVMKDRRTRNVGVSSSGMLMEIVEYRVMEN